MKPPAGGTGEHVWVPLAVLDQCFFSRSGASVVCHQEYRAIEKNRVDGVQPKENKENRGRSAFSTR